MADPREPKAADESVVVLSQKIVLHSNSFSAHSIGNIQYINGNI